MRQGEKEINLKELLLKAHYLHRPCAGSIQVNYEIKRIYKHTKILSADSIV